MIVLIDTEFDNEQNVDRDASIFYTFSQIKQFATLIKFRKSNRQHLKNKQTVKLAWLTLSASFEIAQIPCQTVLNFFDFLFTPVVFWSIKQKNHLLILANLQDICKYVWSFMRDFCHMAFAINYLYVTPAPSTNVFCHCISIGYDLAVRLFANKILPLIYISWVSNFLPISKIEFLTGAILKKYILLLELFIRKW